MKRLNYGTKWALAAILLVGVTAAPAMAEKTTPATGKNSAVPAVPRAIPICCLITNSIRPRASCST